MHCANGHWLNDVRAVFLPGDEGHEKGDPTPSIGDRSLKKLTRLYIPRQKMNSITSNTKLRFKRFLWKSSKPVSHLLPICRTWKKQGLVAKFTFMNMYYHDHGQHYVRLGLVGLNKSGSPTLLWSELGNLTRALMLITVPNQGFANLPIWSPKS